MVSGILKAVSKQTGLICDKKRNIVYGNYQRYLVSIKETENRQIVITIPVKRSDGQENQATEAFLNGLKQSIPQIKQVIVSPNCMTAVIKIGIYKKAIGITLNALSQMVSYCNNSQMISCCQTCGAEPQIDVVSINAVPYVLCDKCCQEVKDGIDEKRQNIKSKKGNFVGGLVGAFLGSLIGVAVWVIIYLLGYIAAVSGLVFAICSIKGFEKLSGKINIPGLIASLVIAVGMLYVAENIALAIEIYTQFKTDYEITFFDAYRVIPDFMLDPEVRNSFMHDIFMGYFMMALASISPIIHLFKTSNHIVEVTKLGEAQKTGPSM